jgi:hypothetical protein
MFGSKTIYGAIAAVVLSYGAAQAATVQISLPYTTAAAALGGATFGSLQPGGDDYALNPSTTVLGNAATPFENYYKFDVSPLPVNSATTIQVHVVPPNALFGGVKNLTAQWFVDADGFGGANPVSVGGPQLITDGAGLFNPGFFNGAIISQVLGVGEAYLVVTGQIIGTNGRYDFDLVAGAVPLPGAVFLFGTVLAGGVGGLQLMRRRRANAAA